jgi:hypothetical protein
MVFAQRWTTQVERVQLFNIMDSTTNFNVIYFNSLLQEWTRELPYIHRESTSLYSS